MTKGNEKDTYEIETKNGAFFISGKIQWSNDGSTLICAAGPIINIVDVTAGRVKSSLGSAEEEHTTDVLTFVANYDCDVVIAAYRSGLIKKWDVLDGTVAKVWKSIHKGPICEMALHKSEILATAATDGVVRLWDVAHHSCTHAFKDCQGVISVLKLKGMKEGLRLFACGDDVIIRCWDVKSGTLLFTSNGHYSKVTELVILQEENRIISCARDKVVMVWDLQTGKNLKTIPVFETVEGMVVMPKGWHIPGLEDKKKKTIYIAIAGDRGIIRVFDANTAKEVFQQTNSKATPASDGGLSVTQLLLNTASSRVAMVTADQNIFLHTVDTFKCEKQLAGYTDEILDVRFVGPNNSHAAIATNSADIKVYNMSDMGCQMLRGHTDFVLTLASSPANPNLLLSGGKDNTVRLWELDESEGVFEPVTVGDRHTGHVTAVCCLNMSADTFLSASLDTTLKLWKREKKIKVTVLRTEVAHSKDVNCVSVAPNDKFAATASQDKTVKLWSLPNLTLIGVLSGHRRGVWSVCFSPVDQILMSSSADCTIKLWSVADLNCLKTLEGHESSVIRAQFLSQGMQIISCSGDGLLKLWTIKTSECVNTFDGHEGKVWALDVSNDENKVITGGSDSQLLIWRDVTQEKKMEEQKKRDELIIQEQHLSNLIHAEKLLDALVFALKLDRPFKVLNIIKDLINKEETTPLKNTLIQLSNDQKERLLKCAAAWNTNAKHCVVAQLVISILLDEIATGDVTLQHLSAYLQDILPYTERHFKRVTSSLQGLQLLEYTIHQISPATVEK